MSNLQYEFLSYQQFPDDAYVKEVVMVSFAGVLILPYQNVKMKNGGAFWCFPGCGATVAGEKKRFNGEFDSKSMKARFEDDLEKFIRTRMSLKNGSSQGMGPTNSFSSSGANSAPLAAEFGNSQRVGMNPNLPSSGAANDDALPF